MMKGLLVGLILAASTLFAGETRDATVAISTGCSGVCVSEDGYVLTAKHCGTPETVKVRWPDREGTYEARLVYKSPTGDGPVLYDAVGHDHPYAEVASSLPALGSPVKHWGYPGFLRDGDGWRLTEHKGRLTGVTGKFNGCPTIDSDLTTWPGCSGGPLFDANDRVIGLLLAKVDTSTPAGQMAVAQGFSSTFTSLSTVQVACQSIDLGEEGSLEEIKVDNKKPYVLVFTADWCAPCKQFKRDWAAGRIKNSGKFEWVFINVDTKDGAESYKKVAAEIEKAGGKVPRDARGGLSIPAFYIRGQKDLLVGYSARSRGGLEGALRAVWGVGKGLWSLPVNVIESIVPGLKNPDDEAVSFPVPDSAEVAESDSIGDAPEYEYDSLPEGYDTPAPEKGIPWWAWVSNAVLLAVSYFRESNARISEVA